MRNAAVSQKSAPFAVVCLDAAANAKPSDQRTVSRDVGRSEVSKQSSALADHDQQSTLGVFVVLMNFEVFGQRVDRSGQKGDLYFR